MTQTYVVAMHHELSCIGVTLPACIAYVFEVCNSSKKSCVDTSLSEHVFKKMEMLHPFLTKTGFENVDPTVIHIQKYIVTMIETMCLCCRRLL